MLKQFDYRCAVCSAPRPVIHHILPRGSGGLDTLDNVIPLCHRCHGRIHAEGTRNWRDELLRIKNDRALR